MTERKRPLHLIKVVSEAFFPVSNTTILLQALTHFSPHNFLLSWALFHLCNPPSTPPLHHIIWWVSFSLDKLLVSTQLSLILFFSASFLLQLASWLSQNPGKHILLKADPSLTSFYSTCQLDNDLIERFFILVVIKPLKIVTSALCVWKGERERETEGERNRATP